MLLTECPIWEQQTVLRRTAWVAWCLCSETGVLTCGEGVGEGAGEGVRSKGADGVQGRHSNLGIIILCDRGEDRCQ